MTSLDPGRTGRPHKRKKLNQPLIKSLIVFVTAGMASLGSAVTGLGAHLGFAPMLAWMFGYSLDKAQGTALRYSICAAISAIVTTLILQGHAMTHIAHGLLVVIGATIGAIAAAPITPRPTATGLLRTLQSIGVVAAIFTVTEATHITAVTRSNSHYALFSAWWQLVLLGFAIGGITQAARLTGGTLVVPALFFLTAVPDASAVNGLRPLTASEAVVESLIVVVVASLLPAWGYAQRRLADSTYLFPSIAGGLIGGILGGWLLTLLLERTILVYFGVVAMFFAAREIFRLATTPPGAGAGRDADSEPAGII